MPKPYSTPVPDIDYYYKSMERLVGILAYSEEQFRSSPEFTSRTIKEFLEPRARNAGHSLDGKMDNTKNYSDDLTFDNYGKLQLSFPEESYYFFMVTAVQKLGNHAKALQNIDLTKEEAFIIFQACMIYISHKPVLQQRLQADDKEPACTGIRKMVLGRSNNGTIRLTPGEVVQLYKICKLIPRPKSVSELENPCPSDQDSDQDSSIDDAVNFEEAVKGCGINTPMLDGKDDKKDIVSSVSFSGTEAAATIFSSIMATIGMFERNSITGGVMKIGATSVHGVLKNCIALRQKSLDLFVDHKENPSHPQICAFNKLYYAGLAAKSALLNAEEAASLLKLLERFPRNIVCDAFDGRPSSADFRLMTQEEMTEKLSSGMFIMLSSDKAIGAIKNLIWLMVPTIRSISMGHWNPWADERMIRFPFPDCGLPELVEQQWVSEFHTHGP